MTFEPGTRVRVADHWPPGHLRTPAYLRGKTGVIERRLGPFPNPEARAYGHPGEPLALYRVRFALSDLWGGSGADTLEAEIYEHWLRGVPDAA